MTFMHLFVTKRKEDLAYVDSLMNICPSPHPHPKLTKTLWLASTHFPTLTFYAWLGSKMCTAVREMFSVLESQVEEYYQILRNKIHFAGLVIKNQRDLSLSSGYASY